MNRGTVFVTGGSGFVGRAVVTELARRGYVLNLLVNRATGDVPGAAQVFRGGLFDDEALATGSRDCIAVIHLVGIIAENRRNGVTFDRIHREGTRRVVDAARKNGVQRYVQMSALGVRPDAVSNYHKTKWQAEEYVRGSGLDWTILRPSMIHGPGGEFMEMERGWALGTRLPFLFMPYFGKGALGTGGSGRIQPIHVDDVARAFVDCLDKPATVGRTYDLAGPDAFTWPQMHRLVARVLRGKPRGTLGIPAWYATLLTRIAPASLLPFNRDQVIMSQEDNAADIAPFVQEFGWTPRGFESTLRQYAPQLQ